MNTRARTHNTTQTHRHTRTYMHKCMSIRLPIQVASRSCGQGCEAQDSGTSQNGLSVHMSRVFASRARLARLATVLPFFPCFIPFFPYSPDLLSQFSGPPPDEQKISSVRGIVCEELAKNGLAPASDTRTLVYGYHDPFITPNLLRKNEVGVIVS